MTFFKKIFSKETTPPIKNIPGVEPIIVEAVYKLFPDVNVRKNTFECILEFKKDRKGVADLKTTLALLKYSKGDLELFRKSAWQSHPHFWMDEISHIFRTTEDAEKWVKSLPVSQKWSVEDSSPSFIMTIRKKYNLILFLVLTSIPLSLWALIMIFDYFNGIIFSDPEKLKTELFVAFIFPLIAAPIISGIALLITKLISIRVLRWIVIIGLGVITPFLAFVMVFIAHFITRKIYIGNKEYLPSIITTMTNSNEKSITEDPSVKLSKLKEMLDSGLISPQDYEMKKREILLKM